MNQNKNQSNLISIGTLTSTHGLKGELKVFTDLSLVEKKFKINSMIYYFENQIQKELIIESKRIISNKLVLKFKGLNTIESISFLKGKEIFMEKNKLILDKNQFLIKDLLNFSVFISPNICIGTVVNFWTNSAYYNLDILLKESDKIINVPFIFEFIKKIDQEKKEIILKITKEYFNNQNE